MLWLLSGTCTTFQFSVDSHVWDAGQSQCLANLVACLLWCKDKLLRHLGDAIHSVFNGAMLDTAPEPKLHFCVYWMLSPIHTLSCHACTVRTVDSHSNMKTTAPCNEVRTSASMSIHLVSLVTASLAA